ncbi:glycosyl transferase family 2 [Lactiplantibacillus plantarum EGD-AQ4]|nr:glycosyl transferase family 2 [Lactiplantibacillus plantarum EGD-AQ4]
MNYASVIVTYNRKALLLDAINSVLTQDTKPQKIILIDNNSTDGTQELIASSGLMNNKLFRYVKLPENIGGSGGFHVGVKLALEYDVDWISLSDDDAIFEQGYFSNILKKADENPEVKAFAGTIKLPDGRIQLDQRNRITNWNYFSHNAVPEKEYMNDFTIDLFTFCGCVINAKLIKQIGLPHGDFFIWYDDIEYSLRVRQFSKIINVSKSVIVHHTNWVDVQKVYPADWREYYWIRNRTVAVRELGRNRVVVNFWLIFFVPIMALRILTKPMYKGKRKHALYVHFAGTRDAWLGRMGKNSMFLP